METITRREIQIGLHAYSFNFHFLQRRDFNVVSLIERAADLGLSGVHVSLNGPRFRNGATSRLSGLSEIGAIVKDYGMFIEADTSGTVPSHMRQMIDAAVALGADRLRTFVRHAGPIDEQIAITANDLAQVASYAADHNITILLENHEDFTGHEVAEILGAVDHPNVGALFDFGNSMMVGEEPMEALKAMAPFVRSVHLKDHGVAYSGSSKTICGMPLGYGNIDIDGLLEVLIAETNLDRIGIENVYGYRSSILRNENQLPSSVTFQPTASNPIFPLITDSSAVVDVEELLNLEAAAVALSAAYTRSALQRLGFQRLASGQGSRYFRIERSLPTIDLREEKALADL